MVRLKLEYESASAIQRAWRIFFARDCVARIKTYRLVVQMRWKRVVELKVLSEFIPKIVEIQKSWRAHRRRVALEKAARIVQRAYRGYMGRSSFFEVRVRVHGEEVTSRFFILLV